MGIGKGLKNVIRFFSHNSPTILTGLAVGGVFTTTLAGIKATPKALAIIDNYVWDLYEKEVEDPEAVSFIEWLGVENDFYTFSDKCKMLSKKEIIKLCWKLYIPTASIALITTLCIIGANSINLKRNTALASIYALTERAFKEYQNKIVETIGKNKELKVRDEISRDKIKHNPPGVNEVIFTSKGDVICYDSLSGRYFKSDIEKIKSSVNKLNRELLSDMFLSVNELYYALGLSPTKIGDFLGWDIDKGMIEIDFSAQLMENGEPCLVLNYKAEPKFKK